MIIWDIFKGVHIEIYELKLSAKFSVCNINIFWDITTLQNIF